MHADGQKLDHWLPVATDAERHLISQPGRNEERIKDPINTLRSHTRFLHHALEKTATARALLSPAITLERYAENLVIWAGAWQTVEHWLSESPFAKKVPQLLPRPKAWLAEVDLAYLYSHSGIQPSDRSLHHSTVKAFSAEPVNLSGFIGVCYVLVGAARGSAVIAKHLETTLAVKAGHGASFFSVGSEDDLSWPQWLRSANEVLMTENGIHAACHWASTTFELFLTAFSESTHIATDGALDLRSADPAQSRTGW